MSFVLNANLFTATSPDASGNITCYIDNNNTTIVSIGGQTVITPFSGTHQIYIFAQCFYNDPNILIPILPPYTTPNQTTLLGILLPSDLQKFYIGKTLSVMFYSAQSYSLSGTSYNLPPEFLVGGTGSSSNSYGGLQTLTEFTVQPCNKPSSLTATPSNTQVSLSWTAPDDGGSAMTNYIVQYSLNANDWITFLHPISNATSITVTVLTNGLT